MGVDRNAATVVGHAQPAAVLERGFDEGRVAGDRLVHRIVDHFGEQMVQGVGVGAADIHAGAATHRLQPFENFDRGRVIVELSRRRRAKRGRLGLGSRFGARTRGAEQVIVHRLLSFESFA